VIKDAEILGAREDAPTSPPLDTLETLLRDAMSSMPERDRNGS